MPHSFTTCLFHVVFSTKDREPLIPAELLERLWAYIGGIARTNNFTALEIGGIENHVHALIAIPPTMPAAKAVQLIKAGAAKWLNEQLPSHREAIWQQGYAAFSIGISQVLKTRDYIRNQHEHHRKKSFQEEYLSFLKKHGIAFDPKYGWG
ncbi:MAG: IS200/IS605 family transposase [Planctomycetota bacterium]